MDILESFGKSAPTDSGLILEPIKAVTKNKCKDKKNQKNLTLLGEWEWQQRSNGCRG